MKKSTLVFAAVALLLAVFVSSCSKKGNEAPVVTITEPDNNATVALSDSLHIEGKMTDDESLHEAIIVVTNSTGGVVFQAVPTVHDLKTYTFHYHFQPIVVGSYKLSVTAEDHDGKSSTAERDFTAIP
jgi:hypothetical protein